MAIRNEATVRQDLIDANADGSLNQGWFLGCVLTWMNEDMIREMVDNMPDFEDLSEQYGWEESDEEEDDDDYDGQPDEAQEWHDFAIHDCSH